MRKLNSRVMVLATIFLLSSCGRKHNVDGPQPYLASSQSKVFHNSSCYHASRIAKENKRWYKTKEDAIADGYRGCYDCKP
jgi:methylphosphotriester-DNA--protein-cysteine methyltransferase